MTDSEMRIRLAEAMGWTEVRPPGPRLGEDWTGMPPNGYRPNYRSDLPDPLECDQDAAMLRAWCLSRGWAIESRHTRGPSMVSILVPPDGCGPFSITADAEEPDPCRRERLALCRAVLQVIEAEVDR